MNDRQLSDGVCLHWLFDVYKVIYLFQDSTNDMVYIPTQLQRSMSCTLQCGICFEELNDNVLHSALLSCHHYFCNECWVVHISTAVREGVVHITCPEYECKKEVDPVFMMSMLEFYTYCLHEVHLTEYSLFSQQKANWCPSKGLVYEFAVI